LDKQLNEIITEVCNSSLRASIITAAAVIDATLKQLIEAFLIENSESLKLFDATGCLGTFSSKIKMAYALGLISEELYTDIDSYRVIRNKCAHNLTLDESTLQSITDKAKNFKLIHSCFSMNNFESVKAYTTIEFAIILIALTKHITNIERCNVCPYEYDSGNLTFDQKDWEYFNNFSNNYNHKK